MISSGLNKGQEQECIVMLSMTSYLRIDHHLFLIYGVDAIEFFSIVIKLFIQTEIGSNSSFKLVDFQLW